MKQHIEKQRHHFADKGPYSQEYGFSSSYAQMSEMDHKESWAPKNRCFWILVLEKDSWEFLRLQRSNQSILKEINSEYSLNGLMLNLKFQYFGPLMQRANLLGRTLMLGKIEVRRRRRQQRMRWLNNITDSKYINLSKLWEIVEKEEPGVLQFMRSQNVGQDLKTKNNNAWLILLYSRN